ncbi:hypothetical protein [Methylosinus sp. Sm6]|uniref:hypothetical protein n=1 Tax=Methylosinus sp. Sm6 TaxID=2866948 RepID=UPI001C996289|nr:hypothetical protein [Methylosinus sp. Sm6]MBY6243138.1 hypothetical protein [Methylosinus sp. Sm6]
MARPSFLFVAAATLVVLGAATWYFVLRRTPACASGGTLMATTQQCRALGFEASVCASAVEKARALALRAAPKQDTSFDCEVLYSDCFAGPDGRFTPSPSFCLAPGATQPTEIRYLTYGSDRLNRKKLQEVRLD